MYVWDKTLGRRGSAEIVGCLKNWILREQAKDTSTKLNIFSDNCGGQSKNINIVLNYLHEIHMNRLEELEHIFLVSVHSSTACARA